MYPLFIALMCNPTEQDEPDPVEMPDLETEPKPPTDGPDDSYVIEPLRSREPMPGAQKMTAAQLWRLQVHDRLAARPEPKRRPGACSLMDIAFGRGTVPMYMYFDLTGYSCHDERGNLMLHPLDLLDVQTNFFGGNEQGDKDVELQYIHGQPVLRIRRAKKRRASVILSGKRYYILRAYNYPEPHQEELVLHFPQKRR